MLISGKIYANFPQPLKLATGTYSSLDSSLSQEKRRYIASYLFEDLSSLINV